MELLIQEKCCGYGGSYYKVRQVSLSTYLDRISDLTSGVYGTVSTRLTRCPIPIFRKWRICQRFDTYLMVLDCDSLDDMLAAVHTLKMDEIGYALVQSSPDHYWIITDFQGSFRQVLSKLKTIPGVDLKWLEHANEIADFTLRGMALPDRVPVFQSADNLRNPFAVGFYYAFASIYKQPLVKRRLAGGVLTEMAKAKLMATIASDPKFEL